MSTTLIRTPRTPTTPAASTPAVDGSAQNTGSWRHPAFAEIARRKAANVFGREQMNAIVWSLMFLALTFAVPYLYHVALSRFEGNWLHTSLTSLIPNPVAEILSITAQLSSWIVLAIRVLLPANIFIALLPLLRPKDDLSDIALTPSQRRLFDLPPTPSSNTPGGSYITPPRYARNTASSRTNSRNGSPAGSPSSNRGSPSALFGSSGGHGLNLSSSSIGNNFNSSGGIGIGLGSGSGFSPSPSPLLQKAVNGGAARRGSGSGSFGTSQSQSQTPFNAAAVENFFQRTLGPQNSPSPAAAKSSAVLGNNKWLYERGRRGSGGFGASLGSSMSSSMGAW